MDINMSEDSKTVFKTLETFLVFFSLLVDKGDIFEESNKKARAIPEARFDHIS